MPVSLKGCITDVHSERLILIFGCENFQAGGVVFKKGKSSNIKKSTVVVLKMDRHSCCCVTKRTVAHFNEIATFKPQRSLVEKQYPLKQC